MSIYIPEPEDWLLEDEMTEYRDILASIEALADAEATFEFAKTQHIRKLVFMSTVYTRHARLSKKVDIIISPYTGAILYEPVTIDMEPA